MLSHKWSNHTSTQIAYYSKTVSPIEWNYIHKVSLLLLLESNTFTPLFMAIVSKFLLTTSLFGNVFKYQCYHYTCSTRDDYMFKAYDYTLAYMPRQTITSTNAQILLKETKCFVLQLILNTYCWRSFTSGLSNYKTNCSRSQIIKYIKLSVERLSG